MEIEKQADIRVLKYIVRKYKNYYTIFSRIFKGKDEAVAFANINDGMELITIHSYYEFPYGSKSKETLIYQWKVAKDGKDGKG